MGMRIPNWDRLTDPWKALIIKMGVIFGGAMILPDGPWIWIGLGNEAFKIYRYRLESKALDKKFEADMEKWRDEAKKWQITSQN